MPIWGHGDGGSKKYTPISSVERIVSVRKSCKIDATSNLEWHEGSNYLCQNNNHAESNSIGIHVLCFYEEKKM